MGEADGKSALPAGDLQPVKLHPVQPCVFHTLGACGLWEGRLGGGRGRIKQTMHLDNADYKVSALLVTSYLNWQRDEAVQQPPTPPDRQI